MSKQIFPIQASKEDRRGNEEQYLLDYDLRKMMLQY